ncbi:reprolysin-like metallopeptidase [Streptomyces lichenis]|uniref:M12 family metallo-peptidase n=1 Tax=Streptomyces lichenis TaxID=2306967 RepID=A0ABT0ID72_9ACTN|nr:M12 family metallo-peptidase [Streptomyces lichenis]MCK8679273.1 M12 family metallo-peptidase [Streptomyces lichenis]
MRLATTSAGAVALAFVLSATGPALTAPAHAAAICRAAEPMRDPARESVRDPARESIRESAREFMQERFCVEPPLPRHAARTVVIDVLAAFTPQASREAGGERSVRARIARAVASASQAFAASGVNARLRLAGVTAVAVPARMDRPVDALLKGASRRGDGIADGLPGLRDRLGADLVTVVTGSQGSAGLAHRPRQVTPRTGGYAYSLVAQSALAHHSLAHEIGHNLGAMHDQVTEPGGQGSARGYFPASGAWSTLEAYESSCRQVTDGPCTRINRFSNPRLTHQGERLGRPVGGSGAADSVRVFNAVVRHVADYRRRPAG